MSVPSQATNSSQGELLLNGDLIGHGDSPQLVKTGVVAGKYPLVKTISVDSKGRVTSVGALTQSEIDSLVDTAYASDPTKFSIVSGRPVLNVPNASATTAGTIKIDSGLLAPGYGSTTSFGLVKIGQGLTVSSGSLALDFTKIVPTTGGTLTSGLFSQTWSPNYTRSMLAGAPAWSSDSAGIDITDARDSVAATANFNTNFSVYSKTNAYASNGSRVCQVYVDANSNWFSAYTDDGVNWYTVKMTTIPPGASPRPVGMVWFAAASKFVMVGTQTSTTIESTNWTAYSTDGINWTFNSAPWASTVYITSSLSIGFSSVIATGRYGSNLASARTTDGITWNVSTTSLAVNNNYMACTCFDPGTAVPETSTAAHTAGMWTCVGSTWGLITTSGLFYSKNGVTWTAVTLSMYVDAYSLEGPCMILAGNGHVVFTARTGTTTSAMFCWLDSGGAAATQTVTLSSTSGVSMLLANPLSSSVYYVDSTSQLRISGSSTQYGTTLPVYPVMIGSTYIYPRNGSNQPGRAGGYVAYSYEAATSTALQPITANKTTQKGPPGELIVRFATESSGAVHQLSVLGDNYIGTKLVPSTADGVYAPAAGFTIIEKTSQAAYTAIRTSDSKWLLLGN